MEFFIEAIGVPFLFFNILISLKPNPEEIPVPNALEIASLAANLPAKLCTNFFWTNMLATHLH